MIPCHNRPPCSPSCFGLSASSSVTSSANSTALSFPLRLFLTSMPSDSLGVGDRLEFLALIPTPIGVPALCGDENPLCGVPGIIGDPNLCIWILSLKLPSLALCIGSVVRLISNEESRLPASCQDMLWKSRLLQLWRWGRAP